MDTNEFKDSMERQIHKSLNELFKIASLNKNEQEIFLKYKVDCEYWLLRSKHQYSKTFGGGNTNFIKLLAIVLIILQSDKVFGAKDQLVKKMFADNSVHRFIPKKGGGIRSTKNSNNIFNTYYELEILSYFLKYDFNIHLASGKIKGKKIPEFVAQKNDIRINVEAKSLDADSVANSIFGDVFVTGFGYKLTNVEREKGYIRIRDQLKRNYESAIGKYFEIKTNEHFIVFIDTNFLIQAMGRPSINYIDGLKDEWKEGKFNTFIGLVIHDVDKTYFIKNNNCKQSVINLIEEMDILQFHKYIPEPII